MAPFSLLDWQRQGTLRQNRPNTSRNAERAPYPYIGLYMILLAVEQCKGVEHASNSLIVSVSVSMRKKYINLQENKEHAGSFKKH